MCRAKGESDNAAQIALKMGEAAAYYFSRGECCSEAIVHAAVDTFETALPAEVVPVMAGLCGGMGNRQATCGVFTGGAVALGMIARGPQATLDKKALSALSGRYHERLQQQWGAQTCGELLEKMGIRNWNHSQCRKLTRQGAELTAILLLESDAG